MPSPEPGAASRPPSATDGGPRVLGLPSLALLAIAVAWHAAPFPWPTNRFDTGIQLCGADLVAAGKTPYADFQTLYTPGAYYLKALAFAVFGRAFDVHSYVDFAVMGVQSWVAWHLAARLTGGRVRALIAFAAGLAFPYPYPSLLLGMTAILAAVRPVSAPPMRRALLAGAIAGVAGWFRQDFGAVAAISAAIAAASTTGRQSDGGPAPLPLPRRVAVFAATGAAAAATLLILLAPGLMRNAHGVWQGLVVNPLATVGFRDESHTFGAVSAANPHFLVIAVLAGVAGAAGVLAALAPGTARRLFHRSADVGLVAGTGILALWSLRYLLLRAETHHLVPAALTAAAVAGLTLRGGCLSLLPSVAAIVACGTAVVLPLVRQARSRAAEWTGRRDAGLVTLSAALPDAATFHLKEQDARDWSRVVGALRCLKSQGAIVLSASARHDRIHDQDLVLYFALGQLPPVFDYHFDPGVTTRDDVQRGIVADAERAGVDVVVLYDSKDGAPPAATPMPLDAWIASTFRPRGLRIGRYEIRVR